MALRKIDPPYAAHIAPRSPAVRRAAVSRTMPANDVCAPPRPLLTDEELAVIAIGTADARGWGWKGSASPVTGWRRALRRLAGIVGLRPVQSLASERLEQLRILAAMSRRGDAVPEELVEHLMALGMKEAALRRAGEVARA